MVRVVNIEIEDQWYEFIANDNPTIEEALNWIEQHAKEVINSPYRKYDPNFGDNKLCVCGHPYFRHWDIYNEDYFTQSCKYCGCYEFEEK